MKTSLTYTFDSVNDQRIGNINSINISVTSNGSTNTFFHEDSVGSSEFYQAEDTFNDICTYYEFLHDSGTLYYPNGESIKVCVEIIYNDGSNVTHSIEFDENR